MSAEARLKSLKDRHEKIDDEILSEERRPAPDHIRIADLKRQKLAIRDEMAGLEKA